MIHSRQLRQALLVSVVLLLTGCAPKVPGSRPPKGTIVTAIPEADGSDADLAVDKEGGIHVTWSTRGNGGVFYQFSADGDEWTHPVLIGERDMGRVFAGDSTLDFVGIYGSRRYSSHDHGKTWLEQGIPIPIAEGGEDEFDGCCFGDTLIL